MKTRTKQLLATAFLVALALFGCTASVAVPPSPTDSQVSSQEYGTGSAVGVTPEGDAKVEDPTLLQEYGPPGGIIGTLIGGTLLILREIKANKLITIQGHKERADEAEREKNAMLAKYQELERDRNEGDDEVAKVRADYEELKRQHHQRIVKLEREHRETIEGIHRDYGQENKNLHETLTMAIHALRDREYRLASNRIWYPHDPPPFTEKMKDEVTASDIEEADKAAKTGPLPTVE